MSDPGRDELVVRYLEGVASDAEVAALEAGMQDDRDLRREFVRLAHLQALFADLPPATAVAPAPRARRRAWALAAAVAALLAVALLWHLHPTDADGPTVSALSGAAKVKRAGSYLAIARGSRLRSGDRLLAENHAELTLSWPNGTAVIVAGGSMLSIGGGDLAALTLDDGMLHASVIHDPLRPFSIATADARARDIGTEFTVQANEGGTVVRVDMGMVALVNDRGAVTIAAGASAHAAPGQAPQLDAADTVVQDQRPVTAAKPPEPAVPATLTANGTVTAVDGARHSFTLTDGLTGTASEYRAFFAGGRPEAILARIAALKVGDVLTVTYVEKEGRRALSIAPTPAPAGR